jgi:hypothetical protein
MLAAENGACQIYLHGFIPVLQGKAFQWAWHCASNVVMQDVQVPIGGGAVREDFLHVCLDGGIANAHRCRPTCTRDFVMELHGAFLRPIDQDDLCTFASEKMYDG